MRTYELEIETPGEQELQRRLKRNLYLATFLAAILGAFLGGCVPLLVVSFVQEVFMGLPRGAFQWILAFPGAIIGAIIGIALVRRSIG
jgi:VIT1/CCC1 family predicted Fe2+/Mn2+ transporter